jgi:glycosyltransferase involved in cell wall biosynthesis
MPAYNAEKYIQQSIDSILEQSFPDFILLIIDDGSADGTESIVTSYNDHRIVYVKNEFNIGVKDTLNKGIRMANTEYIARMDADDIAVRERLKWQIEFMDLNREVGVSGGHFEFFGDESSVVKMPLRNEEIKAKLFFFSGFCHPTVIIRTKILKENNLFYGCPVSYDDQFGHRINEMEDSGLWHQMKHITRFANLDKVLIKYRKEGQNISGKNVKNVHHRKEIFYHYLLKEINIVNPSKDEVLFLFSLQYFKDDPRLENISKYRIFLNELIIANKNSCVYDAKQFEIAVGRVWEQFFYFLTTLKFSYISRYWKASGGFDLKQAIYYFKFRLHSAFK